MAVSRIFLGVPEKNSSKIPGNIWGFSPVPTWSPNPPFCSMRPQNPHRTDWWPTKQGIWSFMQWAAHFIMSTGNLSHLFILRSSLPATGVIWFLRAQSRKKSEDGFLAPLSPKGWKYRKREKIQEGQKILNSDFFLTLSWLFQPWGHFRIFFRLWARRAQMTPVAGEEDRKVRFKGVHFHCLNQSQLHLVCGFAGISKPIFCQTYGLHAGRLLQKKTELTKTTKRTKTTQTATNKELSAGLAEITQPRKRRKSWDLGCKSPIHQTTDWEIPVLWVLWLGTSLAFRCCPSSV